MSAILSPCGTYRYRLERSVQPSLPYRVGPSPECYGAFARTTQAVAFIMVNPSTADAEKDDATIRKVRGFAQRMGFGYLVVGNLFAYRATDIRALRTAPDPTGPDNDKHLQQILRDTSCCVVAWGPLAKLPLELRERWGHFARLAQSIQKPLHSLGTAKDGHPRHPLMLPYSTELRRWDGPQV